MMRRFVPIALACVAPALGAQSILDIGARVAPQFHSYKLEAPSNLTVSEFAVPMFVTVPITSRFGFDIGSSFVRARVEQRGAAGAQATVSEISGLTDTQLRANLVLGNDAVVLTGGVNLPTGKSEVLIDQQPAAMLIGSDFLAFPISNMGTGFGATGGIAVARPIGSWSLGFGLSMRQSAEYEPFASAGGAALRYQPGNEYRGRVGLERPVGTGRFMLGLTYSKFGDDDLAGSIYNTGDRYLSQVDFNNDIGPGRFSISGWNLFRTKGTLADSSELDHENIANGQIAYGLNVGANTVIEPNVGGRMWTQVGSSTSFMSTFGLRMQIGSGMFSILPSAGFSIGQVAAADPTLGVNTTANLTGWHGTLAIRLR
jgi:hypothetical protein